MPNFEVKFNARVRGPVSDGRMSHEVSAYEHDVAEAIAQEGEDIVLRKLASSIRVRTPYYETKIATREISSNRYEIHDGGVVYGHWLEGTGSRNPVTRFKGYWSFTEAAIELKKKRSSIARRILRDYRARGLLK